MTKRRSIQQLRRDAVKAKRHRASEQPLPQVKVEVDVDVEIEVEQVEAAPSVLPEVEADVDPRKFVEILNLLGLPEYLLDSSGADSKTRWRYEPTAKTTVARLAAFLFFVRPRTVVTREAIRDILLTIQTSDITSYLNYSCDVLKRAPSTVSYLICLFYSRLAF